MDANAEDDTLVLHHACVSLRHFLLDRDCAFDRVDDARKFRQEPVAHEFEHAAMALLDFRLEEFGAVGLEPHKGAFLVAFHKRRVADHISGQNRYKLPVHDDADRH